MSPTIDTKTMYANVSLEGAEKRTQRGLIKLESSGFVYFPSSARQGKKMEISWESLVKDKIHSGPSWADEPTHHILTIVHKNGKESFRMQCSEDLQLIHTAIRQLKESYNRKAHETETESDTSSSSSMEEEHPTVVTTSAPMKESISNSTEAEQQASNQKSNGKKIWKSWFQGASVGTVDC